MATTNKNLFGDDSSDEDESPQQKDGSVVPPSSAESPSKRVIHDDFDIDDESSDEPGEAAVAPPEKGKANDRKEQNFTQVTTEEPAKKSGGEDGEDEDDVEFDDNGVVGTSAPLPTKDSTEVTLSSNRPSKKPRHIEVLESQRPPPGTSLHITKLPNLVGIQPEPYDADTYSASLEEQDYRGFVHSMIRWRYARTESGELKRDENGKLMRESNARLVAWDDGSGGPKSYTLCVGNEVLEVDANDSSSNGFAGFNGYLYLSQKATLADDDHTLAGTVLESMGAIQSRLTARPSSLESAAHKSLTVAVRQKTIKTARIAEYVTQEDPEKLKLQKIKIKQDLDKASARKKQSYSNRRSAPIMNRRYLEQEDDGMYDTINIKDMKRGKNYEEMDYGEDSEDDDEEEDDALFNRRKQAPGRAARAASRRREAVNQDDDEEDELVFEEESDDDEIKATSKKKIQHQALVDDDDDDD